MDENTEAALMRAGQQIEALQQQIELLKASNKIIADEREGLRPDALRFRWLAERTAATGLERWVHPFQFLCEAVDERRNAGATMCD